MPMIAEDNLLVTSEPNSELSDSGVNNNNKTQLFTNISKSNEIVTEPISLPFQTDNVITSEKLCQYTQLKRTLCVDGLIRYMPVNDNNIVIKTSQLTRKRRQKKKDTAPTSAPTSSLVDRSWVEIASRSVLPIMCKNIKAELHKDKFGSGSRGYCIRYNGIWYTPNEFEVICGRATSRDWKHSITFDGISIQALINNGILVPHALSCTCVICGYDESSMSPICLFTPYSYQNCIPEPNEKKPKIENVTSPLNSNMNTIHQTNNDNYFKEAQQKITESPDANGEFPPGLDGVLKRLNIINRTLVTLMGETKHCVEEVTTVGCKQIQEQEKTASSALITSSTKPEEASLLDLDGSETKACANCNRKALSECSLCKRTPYCSTFCQNKDWGSHRMECLQIDGITASTDQKQQSHHLYL